VGQAYGRQFSVVGEGEADPVAGTPPGTEARGGHGGLRGREIHRERETERVAGG
jgi:hypothetical protein